MADIVVIGEALVDFFAEPGAGLANTKTFSPRCGGAPANVAVAAAQAGGDVAFVGRVGDDAFGRLLRDTMGAKRVDVSQMLLDGERPTMMAFVALPFPERPEFTLLPGANVNLKPQDIPDSVLEGAKVVAFGSVTLAYDSRAAVLDAVGRARGAGANVFFDVNYRPNIWPSVEEAITFSLEAVARSNVIKINSEEALILFPGTSPENAADRLLSAGAELVCVTLGAAGCHLYSKTSDVHCEGFLVDAIDATGSGDAFVAGVSVALCTIDKSPRHLNVEELRQIGEFANACGAIVATQTGAMEAELDVARIRRLVGDRRRKNPS